MRPLTPSDFVPSKPTTNEEDDPKKQILKIIERDLAKIKSRRVAVLLSAGVDSVLTLAMLREFRPDIEAKCISIGFGEADDEVAVAQTIAESYDCDFEGVMLDDILGGLPKLIRITKEPRWNLYQGYAFEACKEKTIFSGDGGDELFAGYTFRYQKYLSLLPKKRQRKTKTITWKQKSQFYLACHERDWVPDQERIFGSKIRFSWNKIYELIKPYFVNKNGLSTLDQVFLADWNGKLLFDWLPGNQAFSKAFDVRIQSLFLSKQMIRFATHLPWQLKYEPSSAVGKMPLRAILRDKGLKVEPVKKGFSANTVSLWEKGGSEIVDKYVNGNSEVVKAGVINSEWIQKTASRLKRSEPLDVRYINKMLGILALEVWWRLFVAKTMKENEKL